MRALVVYCHPNPESFTASVLEVVKTKISEASVESRIEDLYGSNFDPILSRQGLAEYPNCPQNAEPVRRHVENIEWCNTLIFVYPTWWYGLPAMMKGWLERTMLPGSAFHLPEPNQKGIRPGLQHINRLAAFTTCGASFILTQIIGSPGKRTLLRGLRANCAPRTRTAFAALYSMDSSTPASRARHLARVGYKMERLLGKNPARH